MQVCKDLASTDKILRQNHMGLVTEYSKCDVLSLAYKMTQFPNFSVIYDRYITNYKNETEKQQANAKSEDK